jgi:ketosteroid isomerase-like protein
MGPDVTSRLLPAALVALAIAGACGREAASRESQSPDSAIALAPDLDRVLREYEEAYARRDPAALAALFTDDGLVLPPGRPPVRGRAALQVYFEGEGGPLRLVPIAAAAGDSVGYVIGTFGAEARADAGGKFILLLRRPGAGPWRIAADMANPNR